MNLTDHLNQITKSLVDEGTKLLSDINQVNYIDAQSVAQLARQYTAWFVKSKHFLLQTLPSEVDSFIRVYDSGSTNDTATISHFLKNPTSYHANDDPFEPGGFYERDNFGFAHFSSGISQQIAIVEAVPISLEMEKLRLSQLLARDILTDELNQADELLNKGFIECAGMLAGVALERQLKVICENQNPPVSYDEKDTLGSLNDKLKKHYIDPSDYSRVQAMKTTRNRCSHDQGTTPPTKGDVETMLKEVKQFISSH